VRKPNSDALCKYVAGYNECAAQVTQYLTSLQKDNSDDAVRASLTDNARCCLLDHLADTLQQSTTTAAAATTDGSPQHVTPQTTVDQSAPSSAVYVISPQQVPVTSSTSPAQLRMLPASLNGGPLVLLVASSSPAQHQHSAHQHGADHASELEHGKRVSCDVTDNISDNISGCSGDEISPKYKSERHDANDQSTSSPSTRDQQQNTCDLHMWRPW